MRLLALSIIALALWLPRAVAAAQVPDAPASVSPSPQRTLDLIRARFRAHAVPPFETYTLRRSQLTLLGTIDFGNSYIKRFWVRTSDGRALSRVVLPDGGLGPLSFDRPAFNEARDPGPATADLLEAGADGGAPGDPKYTVTALPADAGAIHLHLVPVRDAARNRLREVLADAATYDVRGLVTADSLFVDRGPVFPVTLTVTAGAVGGIPVLTAVHAVVGGNYNDDGKEVDFTFTDVAFPASLPDWYFDPATY